MKNLQDLFKNINEVNKRLKAEKRLNLEKLGFYKAKGES